MRQHDRGMNVEKMEKKQEIMSEREGKQGREERREKGKQNKIKIKRGSMREREERSTGK